MAKRFLFYVLISLGTHAVLARVATLRDLLSKDSFPNQ